jgi:arylformamidase
MVDTVYRGYDAAAFEVQYNARLQVPNSEAITAGFAEASEGFRARADCRLDLSYGPSGREKLDVFPGTARRGPVLVYIHGGYWRSRDKSMYSFIAEPFVAAGATVVLVNYSLCPHVTVAHIVRQMRRALSWVWHHIDAHGGDHHRVFVAGNSAGGHLTAMLCATDWPEVDHELPADLIKGAMGLSGLYDLEPIVLHPINETLHLDEAGARRLSPTRLKPAHRGPYLSAVGGDESEEFRRQSRALAETWRQAGADASYVEVSGRNHFTIVGDLVQPDYVLLRRMKSMMGI